MAQVVTHATLLSCARCDPYMPTYILPIPSSACPPVAVLYAMYVIAESLLIVTERCWSERTSYSTLGRQARFAHEYPRHTA